ncbi:MAG: DNA recombination protein RmuC [Methylobacterium sp.]|nr:MAG: DNA recombination protein RmuC [Methylobacterium sp.]
MQDVVLIIGGRAITLAEALAAAAALAGLLLVGLLMIAMRARREQAEAQAISAERQRELDDKLEAMTRLHAEMTGRMQTMAEVFGSRQAELTRAIGDRFDSLRGTVHSTLSENAERAAEHLGKLNERLAVIDSAQANLQGLASEMLTLKDVLANKQARGAYGQGRMEAIIRDALPARAFEFQPTLPNRARPDCIIRLPGDDRPLVVDAKFPLEGFAALREAQGEEARLAASRRVRNDLQVHIRDISEKYLLPGQTQDLALMFVPSEALYADLAEQFEDLVQKAHRARVLIVSPSLLVMAVQVAQAIVRDAAIRDQARTIQLEVGKLLDDVRRIGERASKLETHFRQSQEDVAGLITSTDKVIKRGERIEALEFEQKPAELPADAVPLRRPA